MKIAIHKGKGFSKHWIAYCEEKGIPFKTVNCYNSDIVEQLSDCDALMWHFAHDNYKDKLFAKELIYSLEAAGKKVFPDSNTCWHFDDKVGQKYLLEAIGAPLVPSYVFYDKASALKWIEETNFPKVFKLRGGAGSANVKLVKSKNQAKTLVRKAFGKGFSQFDRLENLKERTRKFREGKDAFLGLLKGVGRLFIPTEFAQMRNNEKGYVYFQDFIPECSYDIRVKLIDKKCWAFKRLVRTNDFRASGSNNLMFSKEGISEKVIEGAFKTCNSLKLQSVAFDFVLDQEKNPLILEMSYAFGFDEGENYGFWDEKLSWNEGQFNPYGWMVDLLL